MLAIIDYGVGNLFSLRCSLEKLGADVTVSGDPEVLRQADKLILPGVGAFGDCMNSLKNSGLTEVIKEVANSGKPFMGICLGMQLLFEESEESPGAEGLGIFKGKIVKIPKVSDLKIPHMGWNSLQLCQHIHS